MFNGAKQLTVRTLSLDGNLESKDSDLPVKLSKQLQMQLNQTAAALDDQQRKKSVSQIQQLQPHYANHYNNQIDESNLYGNNGVVTQAPKKIPQGNFQPPIQTLATNRPPPGGQQQGMMVSGGGIQAPDQIQSSAAMKQKFPIVGTAKVKGGPARNVENEMDLYENNHGGAPAKPVQSTTGGVKTPGHQPTGGASSGSGIVKAPGQQPGGTRGGSPSFGNNNNNQPSSNKMPSQQQKLIKEGKFDLI